MYSFIISFILQLLTLPIVLSKTASQLDVAGTLLGLVLAGVFTVVSSVDVGMSAIIIFAAVSFTLLVGAFFQIEDFYLRRTTKIRVCMYFWILSGILIGNLIIYLRLYF